MCGKKKGELIGKWSAQIFLLSHLGRMNILPEGDVTLNKAFRLIYGEEINNEHKIVINWDPYKSLAARYLWHWWDSGQPSLS